MANRYYKKQNFRIAIPCWYANDIVYHFRVNYTWEETQVVVVDWLEPTMGSGQFELEDCGITWATLLASYNMLSQIAQDDYKELFIGYDKQE